MADENWNRMTEEQQDRNIRFDEMINSTEPVDDTPPTSIELPFLRRQQEESEREHLRIPSIGQTDGAERTLPPSGSQQNGAEEMLPLSETPGAFLTPAQRVVLIDKDNLTPPPPAAYRVPLCAPDGAAILKAGRPPVTAKPPRDLDISFVEICTFFPGWLHVEQVILRLMKNGLNQNKLVRLALDAVGQLTTANLTREQNTLVHRFSDVGRSHFHVERWSISTATAAGPENDLTANTWAATKGQAWEDMKLADIYRSVPRNKWPTGDDRLLLTQCLEFAADYLQYDLDTSHIPWIVETLQLEAPPAPTGHNRDQEALARLTLPEPRQ